MLLASNTTSYTLDKLTKDRAAIYVAGIGEIRIGNLIIVVIVVSPSPSPSPSLSLSLSLVLLLVIVTCCSGS